MTKPLSFFTEIMFFHPYFRSPQDIRHCDYHNTVTVEPRVAADISSSQSVVARARQKLGNLTQTNIEYLDPDPDLALKPEHL